MTGDLVGVAIAQLHGHLLRPLGIEAVPRDVDEAITAFVARRDALEREYGVSVPRELDDEIRRGIARMRAPRR